MDTLQANEKIAQLLALMEESGRKEQAADIRLLCGYVGDLENQYASVLSELRDIKQQLSEAAAQKRPFKAQVTDAVQAAEMRLEEVRSQFPTMKEDLAAWAETTMNGIRQMGVSALDGAMSFLGIQQILENIRKALDSAAQSIQSAISQVETVGKELRDAGSHLKNAGRAAVGKEIQQQDVTREGRFQAAVLAPMRGTRNALSVMSRTADNAISGVERLGRTAEQNRGKRERPSVRRRLEQKKESIARSMPVLPPPGRKKSEVTL